MRKTPHDFYTEFGVEWLAQRKDEKQTASELAYISRLLNKGKRVLDLACGYGRFTLPLAEMGYLVDGIDITAIFIKRAREEAKKRNLHIGFRVGDMRNLPYKEDSFDYVISMWNAFSEITTESEQIRTIHEIYRVLKRGGLALIEVRNHRSSQLIEENFIDGHEAMPSYNHTRGSLKNLMKISEINDYRVFIDNFGGRKRLLLEIMKT
ncbi:MAG: class I SAM-dependent methyltransferase [Thermoplasmatales archaeon]|nr:class I SAM-dependent methyltransferase [Thermoplasmatales archaeon]